MQEKGTVRIRYIYPTDKPLVCNQVLAALSDPSRRLSNKPPADFSLRSCIMYTIPVRAPLSLSSIATPVLPTLSTPSVSTMVEMRIEFLEPASTTSCLTLVGLCRYNLSLADPRDFHWACCCFKKTLHFISAEMVEVTGPVIVGVSSTGELGGLGSWKEGTARKPVTPSWPEGSQVRG